MELLPFFVCDARGVAGRHGLGLDHHAVHGIGETFHEEIMTDRESTRAIENDSLYAIPPETNGYLGYDAPDGFETATDIVRSSGNASYLDTDEIVSLLETADSLEVPVR
jgi:hypothetical protein